MLDPIIKKINNKSLNKPQLYILVITPFLFLSSIIRDCKIDVPYGDQWDLIPLLEKSFQGNVSVSDLIVQHNEHRPLFPRLIWIYLARATDWNIGHELMVNFLLGLFIFITLCFQIRSTNKSLNSPIIKWMIPVLALIVFSLNQWENWLWGSRWSLGPRLGWCACSNPDEAIPCRPLEGSRWFLARPSRFWSAWWPCV